MNQEPLSFEEQSRQARESTKRLRKRMIIVLVCLLAFTVIAIPLISFLDTLAQNQPKEEIETNKHSTIIFYEPDFDLDILKDPGYMELNRTVYLCDSRYGTTIPLDEKNVGDFGPAVIVLNRMIELIIKGDADGYNELFSENYYKNHDPEPPFTMQQVYDIKLTKVKETDVSTGGGYTQYEFEVEYRIRHNNGTFRTDIGDGESRKQYFVLSDSTTDEVLIDQIIEYVYKK